MVRVKVVPDPLVYLMSWLSVARMLPPRLHVGATDTTAAQGRALAKAGVRKRHGLLADTQATAGCVDSQVKLAAHQT